MFAGCSWEPVDWVKESWDYWGDCLFFGVLAVKFGQDGKLAAYQDVFLLFIRKTKKVQVLWKSGLCETQESSTWAQQKVVPEPNLGRTHPHQSPPRLHQPPQVICLRRFWKFF